MWLRRCFMLYKHPNKSTEPVALTCWMMSQIVFTRLVWNSNPVPKCVWKFPPIPHGSLSSWAHHLQMDIISPYRDSNTAKFDCCKVGPSQITFRQFFRTSQLTLDVPRQLIFTRTMPQALEGQMHRCCIQKHPPPTNLLWILAADHGICVPVASPHTIQTQFTNTSLPDKALKACKILHSMENSSHKLVLHQCVTTYLPPRE